MLLHLRDSALPLLRLPVMLRQLRATSRVRERVLLAKSLALVKLRGHAREQRATRAGRFLRALLFEWSAMLACKAVRLGASRERAGTRNDVRRGSMTMRGVEVDGWGLCS